jgi:hypothetical protein
MLEDYHFILPKLLVLGELALFAEKSPYRWQDYGL